MLGALVLITLLGAGVAFVLGGSRIRETGVTAPAAGPHTPSRSTAPISGRSSGPSAQRGRSAVSRRRANPSATPLSALRSGAAGSFTRMRATLPGPVAVALAPLGRGPAIVLGPAAPAHGWSTTKVPVLVALMRALRSQGLSRQQTERARRAITQSDNQSILDLFADLESLKGGLAAASKAVQQGFRRSGDHETIVATAPPPPGAVTTFGQTEWSPQAGVRFFSALSRDCLMSSSDSGFVLRLMESIEPSERWGLGSGGFNVPVAFKGGWGPEPSGRYLVRQSGVIDPQSPSGVAVSIVAYPPAGANSFKVGAQMLTTTARWLRSQLLLKPRPRSRCRSA